MDLEPDTGARTTEPGEQWVPVRTEVNGVTYKELVESRLSLADFLRTRLRLTGTHLACEHGVCGACTVLLDGESVRSCLMLAVQAEGHRVTTVEGLTDGDELTPLQEAFRRNHAVQCGFCTSGFLMSVTAALAERPCQTAAEAREVLSGNICRCTGYAGMVQAVLETSAELAAERPGSRPAEETGEPA
jgi:aerobic-type carbon monoxide dehydrogenase small subunit (CoxS/CutS family)